MPYHSDTHYPSSGVAIRDNVYLRVRSKLCYGYDWSNLCRVWDRLLIHMTERFREELRRTRDTLDAIKVTARGTGVALVASAASSV
ncbi:MAG: hypothetical protein CM1200mP27_07870 [Chloroflexota bacterium]|nr:MAG: hypothetical protein CM1200mP27_07870 [Chloroflexota bacterium]